MLNQLLNINQISNFASAHEGGEHLSKSIDSNRAELTFGGHHLRVGIYHQVDNALFGASHDSESSKLGVAGNH